MYLILGTAGIVLWAAGTLSALDRSVPPLPPPKGKTVTVRDTVHLKRAAERAAEGTTILVADGTYPIIEPVYLRKRKNVTIRGASGDPAKVTLRGKGFAVEGPEALLQVGNSEQITVADLGFADCRQYGIKFEAENFSRDVHIYNCRFRDIGVRAIKGSSSPEGKAVGGSIRYCDFENTQIPPANSLFGGNYISAIDVMSLDGWTISDNVFRNIKGRTGGGRGAIFVWVRSKNVTIERNLIVNCDRGIALGNPSGSTNFVQGVPHIANAIVRNNFIVAGADAPIELWWAENVKVQHNTVWCENTRRTAVSGGNGQWKITGIKLTNNLFRGGIKLSGETTEKSNLTGRLENYFVDPKNGDLRLTSRAVKAVNKAVPLADVKDDFDGHARDRAPDIGASEFGASRPPSKTEKKKRKWVLP
jgi:hypothetical protein